MGINTIVNRILINNNKNYYQFKELLKTISINQINILKYDNGICVRVCVYIRQIKICRFVRFLKITFRINF